MRGLFIALAIGFGAGAAAVGLSAEEPEHHARARHQACIAALPSREAAFSCPWERRQDPAQLTLAAVLAAGAVVALGAAAGVGRRGHG